MISGGQATGVNPNCSAGVTPKTPQNIQYEPENNLWTPDLALARDAMCASKPDQTEFAQTLVCHNFELFTYIGMFTQQNQIQTLVKMLITCFFCPLYTLFCIF